MGRWVAPFASTVYMTSLLFLPPTPPHPTPPFQSFPFPHNIVSTIPRDWVPLVSLLICPISVLSVTLYMCIGSLSLCTPQFFFSAIHLRTFKPPLYLFVRFCCFSSGMDDTPHLTSFREDDTLDTPMARLCRHLFIPPVQLRHSMVRFLEDGQ